LVEREQCLTQVEKLVASRVLHGSESLCKLLRYLAQHALDHPGTPIKEYQIATEVLGRPSDFDPQVDSMVRVQAGRLRIKLAEYYSSEGADDPVLIELPKGTYVASFHSRPSGTVKHSAGVPERGTVSTGGEIRKWVAAATALGVLLAGSIVAILMLLANRDSAHAGSPHEAEAPGAFRIFWRAFVSSPDEPWVIFSNAAFVGRPETGMRYFKAKTDSPGLILDYYTGVGEVLSVHELDRVFGLLHRPIRVKRGSLFSLDDAKNNNLIFIGSPSENLSLLELPGTQEFVFQRLTSGPRKGDQAIVNVHPAAGEEREFVASRSGQPMTEDYAVIGLIKGLNPNQAVLILAGTTTMGTQGAVEYVCNADSVQELLRHLSAANTRDLKPFEALIRVKVARGVPVGTDLLAVHTDHSRADAPASQ
jgi:hypothetical protein